MEQSFVLQRRPGPPQCHPMPSPDQPARVAAWRSRARHWTQGWASASAVLAIGTLVCAAIERVFEPANLIAVYLTGVVYVALRHGRGAALFTVVGSVVLFDLLFVAPRWSLKPTDPQYFFTFAVTLLVGLVISHLAARSRQEAELIDARARRTQALNRLALQLARARTCEAIGVAVADTVRQALGTQAQLLGLDAAGAPLAAPAGWHCFGLQAADGALGVLAVERLQAEGGSDEDRELLASIAHQAAVALERSVFEQRSASAAVEAERERLRSTLLAGISHDFRTPLTTIVGSATSLLEQGHAIDEAHREALLRGVLLEARRMHALTSDLLDLTRMEEGAVRPNFEWCPADELVDEARAALGRRLDGRRFSTDLDSEAVVWCDPRLLGQALVNLLDNAVRHTPPGTAITVGVSVAAGQWRLVVQDDGPGIPAGQEREVFKKFFRGWPEPDSRGTGLGLAICAIVAELHGGSISARNVKGARFEMTLPQPDDSSTRLAEAL